MKNSLMGEKIEKLVDIIEMIIIALLAIGIIIGLFDLVKYYPIILTHTLEESYDIFQAFLGHALALVVGVELILMILHYSTKAILELVLFVIARKMLIYSNTMGDLVLGALAITLIFIILRFLIKNKNEVE